MAIEQILLTSSSFDGMRETGGFGQPLHALYPQIQAVLMNQLGSEAAELLAEPVVDRTRGRIDWYAEGDPEQPPVALAELPEAQRQPVLAQIENILGRGRELAERYAASGDAQRMQLGAILKAALAGPVTASGVFLVAGRPVITGWGFVPDRPWEMAEGSTSGPAASPPQVVEPFRDVAIPEISVPELNSPLLESAPGPQGSAAPSLPVSTPSPLIPSPSPEASPDPGFKASPVAVEMEETIPGPASPASGAKTPPAAAAPSAPLISDQEPLSKSEPAPSAPDRISSSPAGEGRREANQQAPSMASMKPLPPAAEQAAPVAPLRYVVVGSRYFWAAVILAVLLALGAGFWVWLKKPFLEPVVGDAAGDALTLARDTETDLRARLEFLLARLAERRGQCALPSGSAAPPVSTPSGASDRRIAIPAQSEVSPSGGESPREAVARGPVPSSAGIPAAGVPAAPVKDDRAPSSSTAAAPEPNPDLPDAAIPADATASLAASGRNSDDMPSITLTEPARLTPDPENALNRSPLDSASASRPSRATAPLSGAESPAQTLEDALLGRTPARPLPPAQPPVKAEPTPEERREFVNRLSAAGAATGEITVTLLWNNRSDLDLVVRCPTGRPLDYQHSAECGGTLDVDANAVRDRLSDRPVENVFWPAGKAGPGVYEVAVRYAPRKDEVNPGETPFQVRLIRGGQESVFKGAIRPNTRLPVTTFTVDR